MVTIDCLSRGVANGSYTLVSSLTAPTTTTTTIGISITPFLFAFFVPVHRILGESPRWLLKTGRYEQAEKEIQRMARWNKKTIPANFIDTLEHTLLV